MNVKYLGRDSNYEGKFNFLATILTGEEITQLENIGSRLRKEGHKYLVINTTCGEFVFSTYGNCHEAEHTANKGKE
jgi:hypothetical protein